VERVGSDTHYYLDGNLFIVVHSGISTPLEDSNILNIYWQIMPQDIFIRSCSWSLADYASSSEEMFSLRTKNFLAYARTIGLRFYPIDEL
jgi:hypothetical protein